MEKNAYLIVSDLHFGSMVTANRIDYRKELICAQQQLARLAVKYKKEGWNLITLFLGDLFHRSYDAVFNAIVDHDFFTVWQKRVGPCYSVLGNHELTYYRDNPFYTLVSTIESKQIQKVINRVWHPLGSENVIQLVDDLQDGDVTFYFNHYGTGIQKPAAGVAIGLFHQDLVDKQILQDSKRKTSGSFAPRTVIIEGGGLLDGYQECFFGHLHSVYGKWRMGNTTLRYLASLGRTNVTEVADDFLERNIPVVKVEDGKFVGVEDNYFNLMTREECILEEVAAQQHAEYEKIKAVKEMRDYIPLGDDPLENLYSLFAEEPAVRIILKDLLFKEVDSRGLEIKRNLRRLGITDE